MFVSRRLVTLVCPVTRGGRVAREVSQSRRLEFRDVPVVADRTPQVVGLGRRENLVARATLVGDSVVGGPRKRLLGLVDDAHLVSPDWSFRRIDIRPCASFTSVAHCFSQYNRIFVGDSGAGAAVAARSGLEGHNGPFTPSGETIGRRGHGRLDAEVGAATAASTPALTTAAPRRPTDTAFHVGARSPDE